jgi:hypothetical protein
MPKSKESGRGLADPEAVDRLDCGFARDGSGRTDRSPIEREVSDPTIWRGVGTPKHAISRQFERIPVDQVPNGGPDERLRELLAFQQVDNHSRRSRPGKFFEGPENSTLGSRQVCVGQNQFDPPPLEP